MSDQHRRPLDPLEEAIVFAIRRAAKRKRESERVDTDRKVDGERRPAA